MLDICLTMKRTKTVTSREFQHQFAGLSSKLKPGQSITIRTALLKDGKAYVQAGGGWVNDSDPEAEFQESLNKSKAMLKAVALAESFSKRTA